jgi:hypothetical protein
MKLLNFYLVCFTALLFFSCKSRPLTKYEIIDQHNREVTSTCIKLAQRGDLVLRMGDDFISQVLADIAPKEKRFSHAGIIEMVDGKPFVYNINPKSTNFINDDTIRLEPIDSFINPLKNKEFGLFRYKLSNAGIDSFIQTIQSFQKQQVRFDMRFDIHDDDKQYCTELIAKCLEKSTQNRIFINRYIIDSTKVVGVKRFFKIMNNEIDLKKYPIITVDNLYLNPFTVPVYSDRLMLKYEF